MHASVGVWTRLERQTGKQSSRFHLSTNRAYSGQWMVCTCRLDIHSSQTIIIFSSEYGLMHEEKERNIFGSSPKFFDRNRLLLRDFFSAACATWNSSTSLMRLKPVKVKECPEFQIRFLVPRRGIKGYTHSMFLSKFSGLTLDAGNGIGHLQSSESWSLSIRKHQHTKKRLWGSILRQVVLRSQNEQFRAWWTGWRRCRILAGVTVKGIVFGKPMYSVGCAVYDWDDWYVFIHLLLNVDLNDLFLCLLTLKVSRVDRRI